MNRNFDFLPLIPTLKEEWRPGGENPIQTHTYNLPTHVASIMPFSRMFLFCMHETGKARTVRGMKERKKERKRRRDHRLMPHQLTSKEGLL